MLTLIERGDLYTPEPAGSLSLLLAGDKVLKIGAVDGRKLASLDVPVETLDAAGCYVVPGLVDPHANLLGAGGEQGWGSRQPELSAAETARAGITTIVGILGADATTRTLPGLLGKVKEFRARGISAYLYTGAMQTPPPTLTGSVIGDLVLIEEVIGVGELAIADVRSTEPTAHELARYVSCALLGGNTGGKAGVTRFHLGAGKHRLRILHELLDDYDIPPCRLYATHVTRTPELLRDAVALAGRGAYVDTDTVDEADAGRFTDYLEMGGPPERFTFSSDAQTPGGTPQKLYRALVTCATDHGLPLERALPHFTSYTAAALGLGSKGSIREGADADVLVIRKRSWELVHVVARGRVLLREGRHVD